MKKQVIFIAALMCMIIHSVTALADDRIIPVSQLPETARKFVEATFPGQTISYAKIDKDLFSKSYEVRLDNGFEIEFDKNGTWKKVNCKHSAVPAGIIPASIAEYVKSSFPGTQITKIDKKRNGYEVELSNDLDLKFNSSGKFLGIDD